MAVALEGRLWYTGSVETFETLEWWVVKHDGKCVAVYADREDARWMAYLLGSRTLLRFTSKTLLEVLNKKGA